MFLAVFINRTVFELDTSTLETEQELRDTRTAYMLIAVTGVGKVTDSPVLCIRHQVLIFTTIHECSIYHIDVPL